MTQKVIVILSGTSTWVVPSDWNDNNNRIICLAGGGAATAGYDSNFGQPDGFGAGGGALSYTDNVTLTKGATINVGPAAAQGLAQTSGNNTWFGGTNYATATIRAEGGLGGSAGGRAAQGVGGVKRSGGGGTGAPNFTGGGAAGLNADGSGPTAGVFSVVSAPGGVTYSSGNGGGNGVTGFNYGGGGGGSAAFPGTNPNFGLGARGFIAIIYTPLEMTGHGFIFL